MRAVVRAVARAVVRAALVGLVLGVALAGCVRIPTSGGVQTAEGPGGPPTGNGVVFVPRGPEAGQTGAELVDGFFQAMGASPMSATVARRFLTTKDATRWAPERGYLTFASRVVSGEPPRMRVQLSGVNRFDSRGAWAGTPPGGELRFTLDVTPQNGQAQDGQLRIGGVPDSLMVPDDWFEQEMDPLSIYFFDASARTLVAEPVFVPRGVQRPTLLVRALLEGPAVPRVERTFVPAGTSLNLSVTLRDDGTADVPLSGSLQGLPEASMERLAAQLAWTLRQVPGISEVRLLAGGHPLSVFGAQAAFDVTSGSSFDLAGLYPEGRLFGLRDGVVVRVSDGRATPIRGPFGRRALGLRDLAVDVGADRVAGVTAGGTAVLAGPASTSSESPRVVVSGRTDLLRPTWDVSGRLWVVDRTATGAVVLVVGPDGGSSEVEVPGVTGRPVTQLLVSADGTRLVAVVRGPHGDRVVESRVSAGPDQAATPRATAATRIAVGDGTPTRIRDLGWRGATGLFVLHTTTPAYVLLDSTLVDGSPVRFDTSSSPESYERDVTDLVSSARDDETAYVGADDGGYVKTGSDGQTVPADVSALTYVG